LSQLHGEVVRLAEDSVSRREIARIIERGLLRTVFQPIVRASDRLTIGFEALSRGPAGHHWERPDLLLEAAERGGLASLLQWEMARAARRRAAERLIAPDHLLFVNAPDTRFWPEMRPDPEGSAGKLWPRDRVVIEISERTPFTNLPAVWEVRDRARAQGSRFALDDVGAGNAGLAALALLAPEFVKIDMAIIRDCDSDRAKQAVIAALIQYAKQAGAAVIAEGVETEQEMDVVCELGVDMIQGFLISQPVEFPSQ
jgi:EAL domain-containing protein (putative c-di-GMP-specific phosphodiesterase class I)